MLDQLAAPSNGHSSAWEDRFGWLIAQSDMVAFVITSDWEIERTLELSKRLPAWLACHRLQRPPLSSQPLPARATETMSK